jgi:hypothetical protein
MHRFQIFFRRWRYLFLLGSLICLLVVEPIASSSGFTVWLFDALFAFVMVVFVLALAQDKVWRIIALILCVPAAILSIGGHLLSPSASAVSMSIGHAIGAIFFLAITVKIGVSLFRSQELSLDSIFGAICGYMLLGVAWALMYAMLHASSPEAFQFSEATISQLNRGENSRYVFIYYSFVTLTTVGYGDVVALSTPARTLSWLEAVTGQLYLAVLIAGLIGDLMARKPVDEN